MDCVDNLLDLCGELWGYGILFSLFYRGILGFLGYLKNYIYYFWGIVTIFEVFENYIYKFGGMWWK